MWKECLYVCVCVWGGGGGCVTWCVGGVNVGAEGMRVWGGGGVGVCECDVGQCVCGVGRDGGVEGVCVVCTCWVRVGVHMGCVVCVCGGVWVFVCEV